MKEPSPRLPERERPPHYGTEYFRTPRVWFREVNGMPLWAQFSNPTYMRRKEEGFCREYLSAEEHEEAMEKMWEQVGYQSAQAREARALLSASQAREQKLREALKHLLENYLSLANSGDAGFWDAEKEPEVIDAREALSGSGEKA